jgi:hypothetical protein
MGFLTIGRRFLNNVPDIIDDRLDVVFRSLQGVSIGCARCHDHKYDPIPTKDYYSLYGVFASSREPDEPPLAGEPSNTPSYQAYLKEREKREAEVAQFRETRGAATVAELKTPAKIAEYLWAAHEMRDLSDLQLRPEAKRRKLNPAALPRWWFFLKKEPGFAPQSREEADCLAVELAEREDVVHKVLFDPVPAIENLYYPDGGPLRKAPKHPVELLLDEPDLKKLRNLQKQVRELEFTHAGAPARAMTLEDAEPVTSRIFIRGNKATLGEEAPRRFLSMLSGEPFTRGSGRLELARAIVRPDNPLTARVMANRIWLHHFGEGLVRTPSDFGLRCEPPSHPALLDWLAARLAESGSLKRLHRTILLSSTWQQRSEGDPGTFRADPENLLLGRMNPRRLDLESMRDSLLVAAGRLDRRAGGRGDDVATSRRRTVYATVNRNSLPGFFRTFDFASPDTHVPQRVMTTVPQQALLLLNSPFILEQAKGLAGRPDVARLEPAQRIARMYRLLFGRAPSERETALGLEFTSTAPWEHYAQVLLQSNEFAYVD